MKKPIANHVVIYQSKNGALELRADSEKETIWLSQDQMAQLLVCKNRLFKSI